MTDTLGSLITTSAFYLQKYENMKQFLKLTSYLSLFLLFALIHLSLI